MLSAMYQPDWESRYSISSKRSSPMLCFLSPRPSPLRSGQALGAPKFPEVNTTILSSSFRTGSLELKQIGVGAFRAVLRMGWTSTFGKCYRHLRNDSTIPNDKWYRIGFKSPATISQAQETVQYDGTPGSLAARGRHDPCVVPRAVPIVESMAAIVVMDQLLMQYSRQTARGHLNPAETANP